MIVVADAGPLIALARIGQFHLLRLLFGEIYVPPSVQREVLSSSQGRPGAHEVATENWVLAADIEDWTAVQLLRDRLDAGESEAIVLALEKKADLILIDEARGRRVAEAHGLNRTGTIGVLIMAKKRGFIAELRPLLDRLLEVGFRMDDELYQTALKLTAETECIGPTN